MFSSWKRLPPSSMLLNAMLVVVQMWKIPQLHEQNGKIFLKRKNTKKSLKEADCNYPRIHRIILGKT